MLSLEQQMCSLEYAKKLKELGVKQQSLFYWYSKDIDKDSYGICYTKGVGLKDARVDYSAFTVAELGELLPMEIQIKNTKYWYATGKTYKDDKYYLEHEVSYGDSFTCFRLERGNTEANARSKMLIYLIENNIMEIPI